MSWLGIPDPNPTLLEAPPPPVTHTLAPGQQFAGTLGPGQHLKLLAGTHTQLAGRTWTFAATESNPAFVTCEPGAVIDLNSSDSRLLLAGQWGIADGLLFNRARFGLQADAQHFAIRDTEHRNLDEDGNGTLIAVGSAKDIVILRPHIHDNGTPSANEPGCNGITASSVDAQGLPADGVWVLAGSFYRNRGDHVRWGRPTGEVPRHLYVSGCVMWEDPTRPDNAIGENAIDVKLSEDVILSSNAIWGFRSTPTSPGEGIVIHDNARWVWALANELEDCNQGIAVTSGTNVKLLRNYISDMTTRGLRVTGQVVAQGNTIRRCPIGIYSSGVPGVIVSNLLNECPQPFDMPSGGAVSHNITGGDSMFVGPNGPELLSGSPAKDAGTKGPSYDEFLDRYGFTIDPAWNGAPDVGCYEIVTTGGAPSPITDLQVLVEA